MAKLYGILIQTDPTAGYQPLVGWDDALPTRAAAEARCRRALRLWHGARVFEMSRDEARELGWIQ